MEKPGCGKHGCVETLSLKVGVKLWKLLLEEREMSSDSTQQQSVVQTLNLDNCYLAVFSKCNYLKCVKCVLEKEVLTDLI